MRHVTFSDDNVLSCIVSTGNFCRLDTALHQVDKVQDFIFFLVMNKEKTR